MAHKPWRHTFLALIRRHGSPCRAADQLEIDRTTPYKLRAKSDDFRRAWDQAVADWREKVRRERAKSLDLDPEDLPPLKAESH